MGDCTVPRRAAFLIRIFTGRALFGHVTTDVARIGRLRSRASQS